MRSKQLGKTYIIRIDHSEDVIKQITQFCKEKDIKAAHFTGFGGVLDPVLEIFDTDTKLEETRKFTGDFAITSLTGNVSIYDKEVLVNAFAALNDLKFQVIGGKLLEAQARVTVEIFLTPLEGDLIRDTDRKYRSPLLDL